MTGAAQGLAGRLYRAVLALVPAPLRRSHGGDMEELFRDLRTEARRRGALAELRFTGRAIAELLATAIRVRVGARPTARTGDHTDAPAAPRASTAARRAASSRARAPAPTRGAGAENGGGERPPSRQPGPLDGLADDLRQAVRGLRASPGVAVVAIAVFTLGIGATTSVFTIVEATLLRPLPYPDPGQLVDISQYPPQYTGQPSGGGGLVALPVYREWRRGARAFEELAVYTSRQPVLLGYGEAARVRAHPASSNLFSMLGASPLLGRGFTPREDEAGTPPVAVLSHAFWQSRLGGDPGVLGRTLTLDETDHVIVGVMPRGFRFPLFPPPHSRRSASDAADVWTNLGSVATGLERAASTQGACWVVGRMRPGVTLAEARADLDRVLAAMVEQERSPRGWVAHLVPLRGYLTGPVGNPLALVLGAVALVLLIACANVANLLLARSVNRRREMSVRAALGAGPWRLLRQLLVESSLLSLAGGAAGTAFALAAVPLLVATSSALLPGFNDVRINGSVLLATLASSLAAGTLAGCAPAVGIARRARRGSLAPGDRGASRGRAQGRVTDLLVVTQIALTLVLLTGAALLLRSLDGLLSADPGFRASGLAVAEVSLPGWAYDDDDARRAFAAELLDGVRSLGGVEQAAVTTGIPTRGGMTASIRLPDWPEAEGLPWASVAAVSDGYFATMELPVLRGAPAWRARSPAARVALVDEAAVAAFFTDADPVGRRVRFSGQEPFTVVGVVRNVQQDTPRDPAEPHVYVPYDLLPMAFVKVVARTAGDPRGLIEPLRQVIREVGPRVPVSSVASFETLFREEVEQERFVTLLLALFAGAAVLLAAAGVYGVMRYVVSRRTREMGIRMALGARGLQILSLVVRRGVGLAAVGIALGLAGAAATTHLLTGFLFGLSPLDPTTLLTAAAVVIALALAASLLPARRAARLDAVLSLRQE